VSGGFRSRNAVTSGISADKNIVMAGLFPAIHGLLPTKLVLDTAHKRGHTKNKEIFRSIATGTPTSGC
jgi:hypothetical protein